MKKKKTKQKKEDISGLVFVGGILIGVGIGFLTNNLVAFSVLGVGVGFILKGIVDYKLK